MNARSPRFTTGMLIFLKAWIPSLLLLILTGCGSSQEKPKVLANLVPAKGTVTLDDEPVGRATVTFVPQEGGENVRVASATTNEAGVYELVTPIANMSPEDSKGIAPGKYKVVVSKYVMPDGSALPADTTDADAMAEGAKQAVPAKYSDFENTSLVVEVQGASDSEKAFDLQLKSK